MYLFNKNRCKSRPILPLEIADLKPKSSDSMGKLTCGYGPLISVMYDTEKRLEHLFHRVYDCHIG